MTLDVQNLTLESVAAVGIPADSPTGKIEIEDNVYAMCMRLIERVNELESEAQELKRLSREVLSFLSDGVDLKCITPGIADVIEDLAEKVWNHALLEDDMSTEMLARVSDND